MPVPIPDDVRAILDEPVFVHVATVNPDGSPHVSVVWIARDGDLLRFSTAEGRIKPRNLRNDPRVSLSFTPLDDPYRNITISGRASSIENNGYDLIDRLAGKYRGVESYEWAQPGEVRADVTITPERISG
jgi:PPOX class probable F420-dependent enzyme